MTNRSDLRIAPHAPHAARKSGPREHPSSPLTVGALCVICRRLADKREQGVAALLLRYGMAEPLRRAIEQRFPAARAERRRVIFR